MGGALGTILTASTYSNSFRYCFFELALKFFRVSLKSALIANFKNICTNHGVSNEVVNCIIFRSNFLVFCVFVWSFSLDNMKTVSLAEIMETQERKSYYQLDATTLPSLNEIAEKQPIPQV